jgi:hypothetical protein
VLHALLRHEAAARAKEELQPVITRHDDILLDRKVLPQHPGCAIVVEWRVQE